MGNYRGNVQNQNFLVAAGDCSMELNHSTGTAVVDLTSITEPFDEVSVTVTDTNAVPGDVNIDSVEVDACVHPGKKLLNVI